MQRLRTILSIVIIGLLLNSSHATWAANYRVKKVRVKELAYEIQVIITADKEIKYVLFTLSSPPRIVIDIHSATLQWKKEELIVERAPIKRVHCSQFKDQPPTVRTVVNLTTSAVRCEIAKKGNRIIAHISLLQVEKKAATAKAAREVATAEARKEKKRRRKEAKAKRTAERKTKLQAERKAREEVRLAAKKTREEEFKKKAEVRAKRAAEKRAGKKKALREKKAREEARKTAKQERVRKKERIEEEKRRIRKEEKRRKEEERELTRIDREKAKKKRELTLIAEEQVRKERESARIATTEAWKEKERRRKEAKAKLKAERKARLEAERKAKEETQLAAKKERESVRIATAEARKEKKRRRKIESEKVRKWESEIKKREKELARQKKVEEKQARQKVRKEHERREKAQKEAEERRLKAEARARKKAKIAAEQRRKETEEARRDKERVIEGYYAAGKHLYREGKFQEASRELKKSLSLSSEHKGAKKYLVKCQSRVEEKPIEKEEVVAQKLPEEQIIPPEVGKEPEVKIPEKKVIYKYKEYFIGPGDVLEIFVWRQDDLTMEVTVDAQGKISFPIVGEIEVGGATTKEIGQKISQGLSRYIRNPWVKVSVKEYYEYKVYIFGQVNSPGRYEMERGQRLIEGLAQAESWTDDAVLRSVVIIRGGFKEPQVLLVNVNQILKGDLKRNIELQAQDIIYVPRRFIADVNYVLNQILPTLRTIVLTDQAVGVVER
ncbi:polysaccharide biosynthesis/export family protein [bacterium]|nr:polysaccharide biosynthesis/export family protein [bacterium]